MNLSYDSTGLMQSTYLGISSTYVRCTIIHQKCRSSGAFTPCMKRAKKFAAQQKEAGDRLSLVKADHEYPEVTSHEITRIKKNEKAPRTGESDCRTSCGAWCLLLLCAASRNSERSTILPWLRMRFLFRTVGRKDVLQERKRLFQGVQQG